MSEERHGWVGRNPQGSRYVEVGPDDTLSIATPSGTPVVAPADVVLAWRDECLARGSAVGPGGMALRDWFAGLAVEGCAGRQYSDDLLASQGSTQGVAECVALAGYQVADALLAAREGRDHAAAALADALARLDGLLDFSRPLDGRDEGIDRAALQAAYDEAARALALARTGPGVRR